MSTNLDQPMQGKGILTARGFTDGNRFGSRHTDDFRTYPKNGISYYIVYLNHTYNLTHFDQKSRVFSLFFTFLPSPIF